jgi:hypothetical protein
MENIIEVNISVVRRHEEKTKANVRLGGYMMDACCPTSEFRCYRVCLDQEDDDLLYVLADFAKYTKSESCRLRDVMQDAELLERVASFKHGHQDRANVDLRSATGLDLMIVSTQLEAAPLIIYDGCHRAIAHYLTYRSMTGVPAFVCVHLAIDRWGCVPVQARCWP